MQTARALFCRLFGLSVAYLVAAACMAQSPFATGVVDYAPAPGQFVNDPLFNGPPAALGRPYAGGFTDPNNSSLVSLGGFGGSITLAFDHTVMDDAANPFGVDAIVFGNAFWVSDDPNRKWAECGHIEISRDANDNDLADDAWFLIPGSHITDAAAQFEMQTWDDDIFDPTYPPEDDLWIPPGKSGIWVTSAYRLPPAVFDMLVIENPLGPDAAVEGVFGYADLSPTLQLGDLDGDNVIDDPNAEPEAFYARPDDPLRVGMTIGAGGGDAFDIAWAIDATSGAPANLAGFDFVRITTAVNRVFLTPVPLGELSPEIDAVADVAEGTLGDAENDGDFDLGDYGYLELCLSGPGNAYPPTPCRVMDFDQDGDLDLADLAAFQAVFGMEADE